MWCGPLSAPFKPPLPHFHPIPFQSLRAQATNCFSLAWEQSSLQQLCPYFPQASVPCAVITLVNSKSTMKSTSTLSLQVFLAFSSHPHTPHSLCTYLGPGRALHRIQIVTAPLFCFQPFWLPRKREEVTDFTSSLCTGLIR